MPAENLENALVPVDPDYLHYRDSLLLTVATSSCMILLH